ncbi:MAG: CBS domain-containing protein [Armatimonadetes bacterium]|nr:CBS domain-containing protein [Armatimonadota bacterium]
MQVREIMTPDPVYVTPDARLNEVALLMMQYDCGGIPVVTDLESRRLIGIITDRDIISRVVAQDRNPMAVTALDAMTADPKTLPLDAPVETALEIMRRFRIRRVPIVEENGACVGIVTLSDFALRMPTPRREVRATVEEVTAAGAHQPPDRK